MEFKVIDILGFKNLVERAEAGRGSGLGAVCRGSAKAGLSGAGPRQHSARSRLLFPRHVGLRAVGRSPRGCGIGRRGQWVTGLCSAGPRGKGRACQHCPTSSASSRPFRESVTGSIEKSERSSPPVEAYRSPALALLFDPNSNLIVVPPRLMSCSSSVELPAR